MKEKPPMETTHIIFKNAQKNLQDDNADFCVLWLKRKVNLDKPILTHFYVHFSERAKQH